MGQDGQEHRQAEENDSVKAALFFWLQGEPATDENFSGESDGDQPVSDCRNASI